MSHRLWTVILKGGQPLVVSLQGNPKISHSGNHTLCHLLLTKPQLDALAFQCRERGITFTSHCEEASTAQQAERKKLLDSRSLAFPTNYCPMCIFSDLDTPNYCGLKDWNSDKLAGILELEKATEDLDRCPLLNPEAAT